MSGWNTTDSAANSEIGPALTWLRRRSRDLVRNTPYGARGVNELAEYAVGTGITCQSRAKDEKLRKKIDDAWKIFVDECDADEQHDFYGLQRLAVRSCIEGGEAIGRLRPRRTSDGLHIPLKVQVLEGDYLDLNKTQNMRSDKSPGDGGAKSIGGYIIQGIEFDPIGRRIAYWLYQYHPGEVLIPWITSDNLRSHRVDADSVLHLYQKDRAGQVHGVPWLAPVLQTMRDTDEWRDAAIVQAKIQACFGAFVIQEEGADGPSIGQGKKQDHQKVDIFEPGMIEYLNPGEDVKFAEPSGQGSAYAEFMRNQIAAMGTGIGLPYEQLSGDLSGVNYTSFKAGQLSFKNHIESFRWVTFIPMWCNPVWKKFVDTAYAAGKIPAVDYSCEWHPPAFQSVDPQKEAEARKINQRLGLKSWDQDVSAEGYDPDEQRQAIAESNKKNDALGLRFDGDGRQAGSGSGSKAKGVEQEPAKEKP